MTPNAFAWLALGVSPVVVLAVYQLRRPTAHVARTTAWMMILAVMFLPPIIRFDLPGVFLNKDRLSFLSIWVALQLFHQPELRARPTSSAFPRLVLAVLLLGVVQTVRTNGDTVVHGTLVIPALEAKDAVMMGMSFLLDAYLPFMVGLHVFRTERDLADLFDVLSLCGLIYLPLCLVELRLSPQLNYWLYGFTPGAFVETRRGAGYRPIVFMSHGLSVANFAFSAFAAALALHRVRARVGTASTGWRAALTGALVVACKSLAAGSYAVVTAVLRLASSSAVVAGVAALVAILVVAFPAARIAKVFPTEETVQLFSRIDSERADSLAFRFKQEDALVARAMERPVHGWGYWARGHIYTSEGEYATTVDGLWIIYLGEFGLVGVVGFFALLVVPVLRFFRQRPLMPQSAQVLGSSLALVVAALSLDLLPNYITDYLRLAFAGALFALSDPRRRWAQPAAAGAGTP